jgi:ComF family protein
MDFNHHSSINGDCYLLFFTPTCLGQSLAGFYTIHSITNKYFIMDWVFPPECAACGKQGYRLCLSCQDQINFITDWNQIQPNSRRVDGDCLKGRSRFVPNFCVDSRHLAIYEGVLRKCVHAVKYDENRGLAELLSQWLVSLVSDAGWAVDLVISVPLSDQRFRERGYNQSALIARPLAARLGLSYNGYGLKRILDTPSQVGLSAEERRKNVEKAFIAEPAIVRKKSILVVDDVMTTGSTLAACAKALLQAQSKCVYAVTIARHISNQQAF